MNVRTNALAEFIDALIVWEAEIVASLWTNQAIKRRSVCQHEEYDNFAGCYICRYLFIKSEARGVKVCDNDRITGWFIKAAYRQLNLERQVCFKIPVFFHNFNGYNLNLIVHVFEKRPDREIKIIG